MRVEQRGQPGGPLARKDGRARPLAHASLNVRPARNVGADHSF
jgi:hypothetical protein